MSFELKKYQKKASDFIVNNVFLNLWTNSKINYYESNCGVEFIFVEITNNPHSLFNLF